MLNCGESTIRLTSDDYYNYRSRLLKTADLVTPLISGT